MTSFLGTFFIGLISDKPNLSVASVWAFVAVFLYVASFLKPMWGRYVEPGRQMSLLEAIGSKQLWRQVRNRWILPFLGMLFGSSLFFSMGLPWSGVVGIYCLVFVGALEDCRMRIERPDVSND
jgi:hypothetical protein